MQIGGTQKHKDSMKHLRSLFEQFIRNGVCGTCVSCPIVDDKHLPELCVYSDRYDHNISLDEIVSQYNFKMTDKIHDS